MQGHLPVHLWLIPTIVQPSGVIVASVAPQAKSDQWFVRTRRGAMIVDRAKNHHWPGPLAQVMRAQRGGSGEGIK